MVQLKAKDATPLSLIRKVAGRLRKDIVDLALPDTLPGLGGEVATKGKKLMMALNRVQHPDVQEVHLGEGDAWQWEDHHNRSHGQVDGEAWLLGAAGGIYQQCGQHHPHQVAL